MCVSGLTIFTGNTNDAAKSGCSFSSSPYNFFSLSSVMFHCCKEVKGLSNRYLLFAESGTHSTAAKFYFFSTSEQ